MFVGKVYCCTMISVQRKKKRIELGKKERPLKDTDFCSVKNNNVIDDLQFFCGSSEKRNFNFTTQQQTKKRKKMQKEFSMF